MTTVRTLRVNLILDARERLAVKRLELEEQMRIGGNLAAGDNGDLFSSALELLSKRVGTEMGEVEAEEAELSHRLAMLVL